MTIAVDAMGGDKGASFAVAGAIGASEEYGTSVVLVGDEKLLSRELEKQGGMDCPVSVYPASEVVGMDESPADSIRKRKDSSIRVAFNLVKEGKADAVVSAGNSGATLGTAMFTLGRIKGVRPAIATLMPTLKEPSMLIDVGANVDCKPLNLLHFGLMASIYMKEMLGRENPRIGLLSIGEEDSKGNTQVKQAYDLLSGSSLNFVGNVEGRDIFMGDVDVVVCDGFVGNVCLKLSEGLAESVIQMLKNEIEGNFLAGLGYALAKPAFRNFRKRVDYSEYGGAPLLGIKGTAIICHGRSGAKAFKNAIELANSLAAIRLDAKLAESIFSWQEQQG
jgi:glycerol-3-phosphate acyltransferase PlsX